MVGLETFRRNLSPVANISSPCDWNGCWYSFPSYIFCTLSQNLNERPGGSTPLPQYWKMPNVSAARMIKLPVTFAHVRIGGGHEGGSSTSASASLSANSPAVLYLAFGSNESARLMIRSALAESCDRRRTGRTGTPARCNACNCTGDSALNG